MVFQTGTITNSHELADKIYGFLLAMGWSNVATLKTGGNNPAPDGYDWVFHSEGKEGLDDIYIRIAAGESDRIPLGDIQHPYLDGYTGFINGFAYQHFPATGTSPEDGFNELGRYGPSLYVGDHTTDAGFTGYVHEYNLVKSSDTPRWREIIDLDGSVTYFMSAFDGRRYIYQSTQNGDTTFYLTRGDLFSGLHTRFSSGLQGNQSNMSHFVRRSDGKEFVYDVKGNALGSFFRRYDIETNTFKEDDWDSPPWALDDPPSSSAACECIGVRRSHAASNFWMYAFRGADSKAGTTTHWTQFDLDSEQFSGYNSPNTPWAMGHWASYRPYCLYVTKEQSGYEHDRIYIWRGNNNSNFGSIAIGDDGYVEPGATWITHASTLVGQGFGTEAQCVGRTILMTAGQNAPQALYKWTLPEGPTDNGTWEIVSSTWLQHEFWYAPSGLFVHDHLCNRARVSEFETNTYWLFGDLNKLIVIVKNALGEYEYLYTGKFKAYANPVSTTLTEDADQRSVSIRVADPTLFEAGKKYMICETTGQNGMYVTSELIEYQKLVAPSEIFTVVKNNGSGELIISELKAKYYAGSRVGEDPMPITTRVHSLERAQTFDTINLIDDDGYADPAWQTYNLTPTVNDTFANATDIEERSLGTFLYSLVLLSEGNSNTGKEVRGQLDGVYSCGTAISSEEIVMVGSKEYIAFDIAHSGQNQRIVVGPK